MGSGKSTLAKKYRSFESKIALLKMDSFKELFEHFEKKARPVIHGAAIASLDYLLKQGFSVVMEGVLQNPDFIQQAVDVANKNGVECKVFELTATLQTLQSRDRKRKEVEQGLRTPLGDEAIEFMFNKLKRLPYHDAIKLNTETTSVEKSIEFIDKHFRT